MRPRQNILFILSFFLLVSAGCANNTRTVKTETDIYRPGNPPTVEKETTITEKDDGSNHGLLSGTVNAAGEVLALPFRAAGGLIRAIF